MNFADEAKKLIKELEFGDKLEQIVKLADSASKVLEKIDIFVDHVGMAIELHTRTLGLILMLLGVFLCRLAISSISNTRNTRSTQFVHRCRKAFYIFSTSHA